MVLVSYTPLCIVVPVRFQEDAWHPPLSFSVFLSPAGDIYISAKQWYSGTAVKDSLVVFFLKRLLSLRSIIATAVSC